MAQIRRNDFCLDVGVDLFEALLHAIQLAFGAAHQTDIETQLSELFAEHFTDPIGGSSHHGPGVFAVFVQEVAWQDPCENAVEKSPEEGQYFVGSEDHCRPEHDCNKLHHYSVNYIQSLKISCWLYANLLSSFFNNPFYASYVYLQINCPKDKDSQSPLLLTTVSNI